MMAVDSCAAFLGASRADLGLWRQVKAMTSVAEIIRLGGLHGYQFDASDLAAASTAAASGPAGRPAQASRPARETPGLTHYEYDMDKLPGFAAVIAELPNLKIKPPTVDLARFGEDFRPDDLASTDLAPVSPQFHRWRAVARREHAGQPCNRDFHLVNLDDHVDHAEYDRYLAAKTRVLAALEDVFGDEARFSGCMWYPPSSYRLWHTNEDQPGWRMYLIDFDDDPGGSEPASFFRYQQPGSSELVTLPDRPRLVRFFKVEQDPGRLFWHCIVNATRRHRWSFGFTVPDTWLDAVAGRSGTISARS
jgi:hypothetical protein